MRRTIFPLVIIMRFTFLITPVLVLLAACCRPGKERQHISRIISPLTAALALATRKENMKFLEINPLRCYQSDRNSQEQIAYFYEISPLPASNQRL